MLESHFGIAQIALKLLQDEVFEWLDMLSQERLETVLFIAFNFQPAQLSSMFEVFALKIGANYKDLNLSAETVYNAIQKEYQ